jgi:hypothetical protein
MAKVLVMNYKMTLGSRHQVLLDFVTTTSLKWLGYCDIRTERKISFINWMKRKEILLRQKG